MYTVQYWISDKTGERSWSGRGRGLILFKAPWNSLHCDRKVIFKKKQKKNDNKHSDCGLLHSHRTSLK